MLTQTRGMTLCLQQLKLGLCVKLGPWSCSSGFERGGTKQPSSPRNNRNHKKNEWGIEKKKELELLEMKIIIITQNVTYFTSTTDSI